MKTIDAMLENCMLWLTDLSVYRTRLNQLQKHLNVLRGKYVPEGNFDLYSTLSQKFKSTSDRLTIIESKVIHTVNKHLNELYKAKTESQALIENENELFDNMMLAGSMMIDLQRTIVNAWQPKASVRYLEKERSSTVISMPALRKSNVANRV